MRMSVLQENLVKGLGIIKGAVITRPSLPVLDNVLLTHDSGRLRLTATDLDLSISVWVGARIEQEGEVTVPAKTFYDIVNSLSPEHIDLELNVRDQTLLLECGGAKAQLKGISADEFPYISIVTNPVLATVSAAILKDMIDEVVTSAASEDNRPVLTAVYARFDGDTVTMASADGYRLTVRKEVMELNTDVPVTLLIPSRTLREVSKAIGKMKGKGKKLTYDTIVSISADTDTNKIMFHMGDIEIVSQLIEGTFPEYERIMPPPPTTTTIVYRDEFLRACKRAAIFAKDSSNAARLNFKPASDGGIGTLVIEAYSSAMGEMSSMVDASIKGIAMQAAFNVEYLIDVPKTMADDQIVIETIDFASPAVLRGVGRTNLYYVIMPMQVGQ